MRFITLFVFVFRGLSPLQAKGILINIQHPLPIPLNLKSSSQFFNRRPLMDSWESTYPNPPIGQLTEPRDAHWQFWEMVKASSLVLINGQNHFVLALRWALIRFIATIIRARVRFRVRVSDIRVKNFSCHCMHNLLQLARFCTSFFNQKVSTCTITKIIGYIFTGVNHSVSITIMPVPCISS